MSESNCKECGHPTEWAQDIGSAVCTQCGTLADPSQQSALTSSLDPFPSDYAPPTTLKSIRRNTAWDLPGQSSDSRNHRNKLTIHNLIRTLADRLGHHGVATRAQAIFDSTMQRTSMKWGKAAKLAAGAAIVFAMREQERGDRTHYVAHLLSEPVVSLKRTQLHLLSHLNLTLPRTHPCVHLPALASHVTVLASASPTSLPKDTIAFLKPLVLSAAVLQDVMRTARMLYNLTTLESRISNGTSTGATACALLLLALEAHAHPPRSAPQALVLVAQLGAALGARGAAVMARYRMLLNLIEADAVRVPWLAGTSSTGSKRVSRRSRVAKAVLDVLQFHNELEQAEIAERGGPIGIDIDEEEDEGGIARGNQGEDEAALDAQIAKVELKMPDSMGSMSRAPKDTNSTTGTTASPVRRYKKPRTTTTQAACFLLEPLAHGAPVRAALAHTTYLLSSDVATGSTVPPTRLQLLAVERGNAEAIHDDELFSDGELEGIVIDIDEKASEERGRRARALQMMWGEEVAETTRVDPGVETVREGRIRKERVDMNKLAALLDSDDPFVALGIEESSPSDEGCEEVYDDEDRPFRNRNQMRLPVTATTASEFPSTPEMEFDLYLPSFRTMRKRSRSRSPTPCEHDRPLKRLSVPAFAVGNGACEPPPSFTPPHSTSPLSVQETSSAVLPFPCPAKSAYIHAADSDRSIQDEWVDLTRNLTLLSARGTAEVDIDLSGSREETMMNLDEPPQPTTLLYPPSQHGAQESPDIYIGHMAPQLLDPYSNAPTTGFPSSRVTPPAAVAFLRAPTPPTMPTPPLCSTPLPSHLPFSAARVGTPLLARRELQEPQLPLPGPTRRSRFTMGPRPNCDKCLLGVPGHYAHFD